MKELMKSNIYDVDEVIIIVGSCLKYMQPLAFKKLEEVSNNIYELCLEESHINMAITKIGGILRTGIVKKLIFATVDESPHCIQMQYIQDELSLMMDLRDIEITNYVAVDNELIEIDKDLILLSKKLKDLKELKEKEAK